VSELGLSCGYISSLLRNICAEVDNICSRFEMLELVPQEVEGKERERERERVAQARTDAHTDKRTNARAHTQTHTLRHKHHIHTRTQVLTHTRTHTHAHTHTHTHTQILTNRTSPQSSPRCRRLRVREGPRSPALYAPKSRPVTSPRLRGGAADKSGGGGEHTSPDRWAHILKSL
jgi:hypothetical protein